MIRPEAVKLVKEDPAHVRRLTSLRSTIASLDAEARRVQTLQAAAASASASKARERKVHLNHATLQAIDDEHKSAADKTHFLRPYGLVDATLWKMEGVREWYGGTTGRQDGKLAFSVKSGGGGHYDPVQAGYLRPRLAAEMPVAYHGEDIELTIAPRLQAGQADPRASVRAALRQHWQAGGSGAGAGLHWSARDIVLASEKQLSQTLLTESRYDVGAVRASQPYKDRPAVEEDRTFKRPTAAALMSMEREKYNVQSGGERAAAARVVSLSLQATDSRNYFGHVC
jgi:hypothetical protein